MTTASTSTALSTQGSAGIAAATITGPAGQLGAAGEDFMSLVEALNADETGTASATATSSLANPAATTPAAAGTVAEAASGATADSKDLPASATPAGQDATQLAAAPAAAPIAAPVPPTTAYVMTQAASAAASTAVPAATATPVGAAQAASDQSASLQTKQVGIAAIRWLPVDVKPIDETTVAALPATAAGTANSAGIVPSATLLPEAPVQSSTANIANAAIDPAANDSSQETSAEQNAPASPATQSEPAVVIVTANQNEASSQTAPATTSAQPTTQAAATTALLAASVSSGWSASSSLSTAGAGQKAADPTKNPGNKTENNPGDTLKASQDNNALTQAAALTVAATPQVVPLAVPFTAPATTGKDGSHVLDAAPLTYVSGATLQANGQAQNGAGGNTNTDGSADSQAGAFSLATDAGTDPASASPPAPLAVASDSFGQSKFVGSTAEALSVVQADTGTVDKAGKSNGVAGVANAAAPGNDNILSTAGLTLVRQENSPGLATSTITTAAPTAASSLFYQTPVDQVSVIMQRAAANQTSAMTIALNPAELGRVEVSLKFGKNGSVQASVMADKAGTLDLLKNDQSTLHQALESVGFSPDSSSLSFSLRDDQAQQGQQNFEGQNGPATGSQSDAESDSQLVSSAIHYAVQDSGAGHVNLFV